MPVVATGVRFGVRLSSTAMCPSFRMVQINIRKYPADCLLGTSSHSALLLRINREFLPLCYLTSPGTSRSIPLLTQVSFSEHLFVCTTFPGRAKYSGQIGNARVVADSVEGER